MVCTLWNNYCQSTFYFHACSISSFFLVHPFDYIPPSFILFFVYRKTSLFGIHTTSIGYIAWFGLCIEHSHLTMYISAIFFFCVRDESTLVSTIFNLHESDCHIKDNTFTFKRWSKKKKTFGNGFPSCLSFSRWDFTIKYVDVMHFTPFIHQITYISHFVVVLLVDIFSPDFCD